MRFSSELPSSVLSKYLRPSAGPAAPKMASTVQPKGWQLWLQCCTTCFEACWTATIATLAQKGRRLSLDRVLRRWRASGSGRYELQEPENRSPKQSAENQQPPIDLFHPAELYEYSIRSTVTEYRETPCSSLVLETSPAPVSGVSSEIFDVFGP